MSLKVGDVVVRVGENRTYIITNAFKNKLLLFPLDGGRPRHETCGKLYLFIVNIPLDHIGSHSEDEIRVLAEKASGISSVYRNYINRNGSDLPRFIPPIPTSCVHNWKGTTLMMSIVFDCIKCGIKKESL